MYTRDVLKILLRDTKDTSTNGKLYCVLGRKTQHLCAYGPNLPGKTKVLIS